jgi:hypothetical protein
MVRYGLVVLLMLVWFCPPCWGENESRRPTLIPVKPSFHEASYVPGNQEPREPTVQGEPMPTPREQMYVFWLMGRAISYPLDKAESYLRKLRDKATFRQITVQSAPPPNPFDRLDVSEIPPAPPALHGAAAQRQ